MQFEWPTVEQIFYRVIRLRRLLLLCLFVPLSVFTAASFIAPVVMSATFGGLAVIALAVLLTGCVALFPNAADESISVSVAATGFVCVFPWLKMLILTVPSIYADAAWVALVFGAVCLTGGCVVVFRFMLSWLIGAGPVMQRRLVSDLRLPCSPAVARQQFALQPGTRRGRVVTGQAGDDGFFDVAVMMPCSADPELPARPLVVRLAAKTLVQAESLQQTMLVLPNGAISVTATHFVAVDQGCRITVSELPGDFTLGMHVMFWLTDQHMDNLIEIADKITGVSERVNSVSHGVSLSSVVAAVLSPRYPVANRIE